MARNKKGEQLKVRVKIGVEDTGVPIYKWASGMTTEQLHDSIVQTYVESGLINRFLDKTSETKNGMLFREYAMKWFETFKVPNLRPTTTNGYRSNLRKHILPHFGEMYLREIMTSDVQDFLNERSDLAKNTLHTMLVLLAEIFDGACEDNLMESNPARSRRISIPSEKQNKRNALPVEQILEILQNLAKLPLLQRRYMALLLFTGMRRGEVLGLRWSDIDVQKKVIYVRRAVSHPVNQPIVGKPKTDAGLREIPLDDQLITFLEHAEEEGYIIGGELPLTLSVYRARFEAIRGEINLYGATAHVFRHSYLSMLSKANVAPRVIQAIGGHASIKTTNRYLHAFEDDIQDAGGKVSLLFQAS